MQRGKATRCLMTLFQVEDSSMPECCRVFGALKSVVWLGVSILMGLGVGQLS